MKNFQELNQIFSKTWTSDEEVDWVWIARNMSPDLEFMKEHALKLNPNFVRENPNLKDENGILCKIYSDWANYVYENIKYPPQTREIIEYINQKIQEDDNFPENLTLRAVYDIVGFHGMDQGTLYDEKIYLNDSDKVISRDMDWSEIKEILLGLLKSGEESPDFWEKYNELREALEGLSKEELLSKLQELSEDELIEIILDHQLENDED